MRQIRVLFLLFFCLAAAKAETPLTATDDAGNRVQLNKPPDKIVSLSPHLTEILFSIGVGDRLVATVRHSDYPAAAKEIPVLGDAFSVGVESVVSLDPDLILAWTTGGNQRAHQQLRDLGYPIFFSESPRLEDIGRTVENIAVLVGKPEEGKRLHQEYVLGLEQLRLEGRAQERRTVFFQISDNQLFTVNNTHLIGQAIDLCNGENIFADTKVAVPMVSLENMVALNPELIIVSKPYPDFVSSWSDEWQRLGWSDRVRMIDASLITRPSLRMLEGITEMCNLLRE